MKNILFIQIPKTGSTSVVESFNMFKLHISHGKINPIKFDNSQHLTTGHLDVNFIDNPHYDNDFYKNSFKFCIIRNPYDRAVSLFFFLKSKNQLKKFNFKSWIRYLHKNRKCIPKNRLYDKNVVTHKQINNMWNPMVSWIPKDINKIYYLEDGLQNIIQDVCKNIQCEVKDTSVRVMNKSKHDNFKKYYDFETCKLLEEIYKDDFDRFKYKYMFN